MSSVVGPGMTEEEFGHLGRYAMVYVARLVSNTSSQQKEGSDPSTKVNQVLTTHQEVF